MKRSTESNEEQSDKFKMFDEYEPGKPQNWGSTIAIIIIVCVFNIGILIGLRMLLEVRDNHDESIFTDDQQSVLIEFLGIFALSFGFGCCFCFCCACKCPSFTKRGLLYSWKWLKKCGKRRKVQGLQDLIRTLQYEPYTPSPTSKSSFKLSTMRSHPFSTSTATSSSVQQLDPTSIVVVPSSPTNRNLSNAQTSAIASPSTSTFNPNSTSSSKHQLFGYESLESPTTSNEISQHGQLMLQLHRLGLLPPPDSPSRRLSCPIVPSFRNPKNPTFQYPPFR
ncbi:hypothetical protein M3Y98_00877800 [Aphelenchoides besseyi]|nr:hypothetical protein M3Y98_00877800 [Aphelenchoides besseyi]KAI6195023.1 hypothetical protein M3Y96_01187100 [Aphelenchoides besseyi]